MDYGSPPAATPVPERDGNSDVATRSRSGSASSVSHKRSISISLFSKLTSMRMNQPRGNVAEPGIENEQLLGEEDGQMNGRDIPDGKGGIGGKATSSSFQQQIRTRRRKGSLRKTALLGTGVLRMSQKGLPSRAVEVARGESNNGVSAGKENRGSNAPVRFPDLQLAAQDEDLTSSQKLNPLTPFAPRPPIPPARPSPQPTWVSPPSQRDDEQQQQQNHKSATQPLASPSLSETCSTASSLRDDDAPTDDEGLNSFSPLTNDTANNHNALSRISSHTSSISTVSSLPPRRLPLTIPTPPSSSDSFLPPPPALKPDTTTTTKTAAAMPPSRARSSSQRVRSPLATNPAEMASAPEAWDYSETEWWGWIILLVTWAVFVVGMGSCLGVWSWAWDVGETPYAPPELEDDPTLPIVGYYPALIILTAVMAWVWVVVAWMGMKYFRHANISGEDV
ncbi:hypothetical protein PRK78_007179 [Emydomyces testavorans]|uniref:Uncharacterized protein n=1 Tax=Emydomyces testavorans TaxID=2070801 RepID=A0AAF0DPU2_9EURO|nr:hypothetical protein PRK78_007179 [Emydomyces testavorans]